MYSKHKYRRLTGKMRYRIRHNPDRLIVIKNSTTPYCITEDTQPADAAEYVKQFTHEGDASYAHRELGVAKISKRIIIHIHHRNKLR
jgi:hypothetical protein